MSRDRVDQVSVCDTGPIGPAFADNLHETIATAFGARGRGVDDMPLDRAGREPEEIGEPR